MADAETLRARFAATAGRLAELEEARRADLAERVRRFVEPSGAERALDAGTGTGALAFALSPLVAEVVGVDLVSELLDEARKRAGEFPNVSFVEGDVTKLPPDLGEFDLSGSLRTLHHVRRPELAVSELARVTRSGGRILVVDQLAPADPLFALDLDRFERARDPSHERAFADADFRQLFESNGLRLLRSEFQEETRDFERYLDLAGCDGGERIRARDLAPSGDSYTVTIGWYLLAR
jgi:ubiquinone/menaquinone biosynthesis C-methylase UbiE